jgi:dihydroxyacetone kinase
MTRLFNDSATFTEDMLGTMDLGLGIHGEPGVSSHAMPTAAELATLLVSGVLAETPEVTPGRVAVILNGLAAPSTRSSSSSGSRSRRCLPTRATSSCHPRSGSWSPASTWPAAP